MDLHQLVANRRWLSRDYPFRHFWARDVFLPGVYRDLEAAFQELLSRGFGDDGERFSRTIAGYDVFALSLQRSLPQPLHVFISRPYHDLLAALAGVNATGDVNGSLHHHAPGSLSGRPHNDLNPGWFPTPTVAQAGEVNLSDARLCSYHTGRSAADPAVPVHEAVRAVAALFYLNNPPWSAGDGGETGLYPSAMCRTDAPVLSVPPLNNSLLVFECTPDSYHAFLRNRRHPRNSIILWLHRAKAEVVARWGQSAIVGWDGPPVLNEVGS